MRRINVWHRLGICKSLFIYLDFEMPPSSLRDKGDNAIWDNLAKLALRSIYEKKTYGNASMSFLLAMSTSKHLDLLFALVKKVLRQMLRASSPREIPGGNLVILDWAESCLHFEVDGISPTEGQRRNRSCSEIREHYSFCLSDYLSDDLSDYLSDYLLLLRLLSLTSEKEVSCKNRKRLELILESGQTS